MWFEELMGFTEQNSQQVRQNIDVIGNKIISKVNNQEYVYGKLTTPSLNKLRYETPSFDGYKSRIKLTEVVGNVQTLHCLEESNGALFQAASQFNLLEMVSPNVTPEEGVGKYEYDLTQGPACAIVCGAGTIYRNYFAFVNGKIGQTSDNQIDCIRDLGEELDKEKHGLWKMSNGYALVNSDGLKHINKILTNLPPEEHDRLKGLLRIGIQADTQVTLNNCPNFVTQVYCSALPIAYTKMNLSMCEPFARFILEATYEATMYAALNNYNKSKNNKVYLTLVGGGVFGNRIDWILNAIEMALFKFNKTPLHVIIVSYGSSDRQVQQFVNSLSSLNY